MNSHSMWGALLRVVRPLHHKKRAPNNSKLAHCILFSLLPSTDRIITSTRTPYPLRMVRGRLHPKKGRAHKIQSFLAISLCPLRMSST